MNDRTIAIKIRKLLDAHVKNKIKAEHFIPGKSKVRYSGAYYKSEELTAIVDSLLKGWFGLGINGEKLESKLSQYVGSNSTLLTNSGSSASLLSMSAITSYLYADHIQSGDEVITPACTFATTAAAIIHKGLKPVFIDVDIDTFNSSPKHIEEAITPRTRAIFLPHTLGNPNDMDPIMKLVKKNKLLLVEDNCDALGSTYKNQKTGSFGVLATCSFYPAHHITMAGEGGAVFINDPRLHRVVMAFRNWGRGCWCTSLETDENGACGHRFDFKIDGIPIDHKYYFLELGYNLKPVEMQAAMGLVQLKRFPAMAKTRRDNFSYLYSFFKSYEQFFILPRSLPTADPCWFSFPLTIRDDAPFERRQITKYLEENLIETRTVFAGNIVRQPAMKRTNYSVVGTLVNSDKILKDTFFIGVGPHLGKQEISYIQDVFKKFFRKF